jgi:hypothetical protein
LKKFFRQKKYFKNLTLKANIMMHDKQKPEKYFNAEKNEFQNTICQIKIIFPEKLFLGHFI